MGGVDRRHRHGSEILMNRRACFALAIAALAMPVAVRGQTDYQQLGKSIFKTLIETNTTASVGNTTVAAQSMAKLFLDTGFPAADVQVVGPAERNRNLVVRYRGASAHRPLLLMGHIDVVEALRSDWTVDPFVLTEKDGYYYGRGTQDMKGSAATLVAALLRLKSEGWKPDRDIILALTSGEEGGSDYVGMQWLIQKQRPLIDAEYAINVDAGGGEIVNGKHALVSVQAAEKVYHSVTLTATNRGGHSSLPRPDNAIYSLSRALDRLAAYTFPANPNDIVRAFFKQAAATAETPALGAAMRAVASGQRTVTALATLSKVPLYNALLRTTCVATMLQAGHAENALPATAKATVNCRILPGEDAAAVERTLVGVIADTSVTLAAVDTPTPSPPSPLRPDVFSAIDGATKAVWSALPIVPDMSTGASDGLFIRNAGIPVYGVTGLFIDVNDNREHGKDERILVTSFQDGLKFAYELIKRLGTS
jgi:acetylornithine deacetylase/succinyl-diaminopimelate desuccinylase-like protein